MFKYVDFTRAYKWGTRRVDEFRREYVWVSEAADSALKNVNHYIRLLGDNRCFRIMKTNVVGVYVCVSVCVCVCVVCVCVCVCVSECVCVCVCV